MYTYMRMDSNHITVKLMEDIVLPGVAAENSKDFRFITRELEQVVTANHPYFLIRNLFSSMKRYSSDVTKDFQRIFSEIKDFFLKCDSQASKGKNMTVYFKYLDYKNLVCACEAIHKNWHNWGIEAMCKGKGYNLEVTKAWMRIHAVHKRADRLEVHFADDPELKPLDANAVLSAAQGLPSLPLPEKVEHKEDQAILLPQKSPNEVVMGTPDTFGVASVLNTLEITLQYNFAVPVIQQAVEIFRSRTPDRDYDMNVSNNFVTLTFLLSADNDDPVPLCRNIKEAYDQVAQVDVKLTSVMRAVTQIEEQFNEQ